ncbi:four-carbon acid sugar kinase family protein [Halalkalibacter akibai]|uniref:Four-carbon acid sugar kinase family protein n=1 Tax=Halalkalibacter akibai (strain ATCC 43226 / DSM 21942 / CIP 109018 / JCM 9157 / 1139) TaxID=1236973 RepID=W4QV59_HALA3|nr:four-carbon acid sugar kinase family protein [Halalkalibacter akibai]GAE35498.1 hypothetical protein JCM9157_2609 [Halalkalibacter akibai JCM 9157]
MKVAVIADDLTGANDTGVQFARSSLKTAVLLESREQVLNQLDCVVVDTDSRSVSSQEAYRKVKEFAEFLKEKSVYDLIYKKIDSTLRGHIGAELDAIYDVWQPDFIVITPAYPKNNRKVIDGHLFVSDKLLHETEISSDPRTPVMHSYLPDLLKQTSRNEVTLITNKELAKGFSFVEEKLQQSYKRNIPYIAFDSADEKDLEDIVSYVLKSKFNVIWSGSAGLANYLTPNVTLVQTMVLNAEKAVLMVVGTVNHHSRKQLEKVLKLVNVRGIKLKSGLIASDTQRVREEVDRILEEMKCAFDNNESVVLYTEGTKKDIELAIKTGSKRGLSADMVSQQISKMLGEVAAEAIERFQIKRLFLTGGDTARAVCISLGILQVQLLEEVEPGMPICNLVFKGSEIKAITKAGAFGSVDTMVHSLQILRGEKV